MKMNIKYLESDSGNSEKAELFSANFLNWFNNIVHNSFFRSFQVRFRYDSGIFQVRFRSIAGLSLSYGRVVAGSQKNLKHIIKALILFNRGIWGEVPRFTGISPPLIKFYIYNFSNKYSNN